MAKTPWSFGFLSAIGLNNEYLYIFIHVNVCVHVCLYVKYTLNVFDWIQIGLACTFSFMQSDQSILCLFHY